MTPSEADTKLVQFNGGANLPLPIEKVNEYIRASKAENTLRGYRADWREFCDWADRTI
jgi:hypothetical protein